MPATAPAPQDTTADQRYELLSVLGKGGMSTVHLACQSATGNLVALKQLRPELQRSRSDRELFVREAALLEQLGAAGVRRVPRLRESVATAWVPYLAMDRIDGDSLSAFPAADAHWTTVARLAAACARIVADVHDAGVVHRDLNPSNFLRDADGQPWLIDFGVACRIGELSRAEKRGVIHGTPAYMAPERVTTFPADNLPPGDVFSLGVMLYELLTGELPFSDGGAPQEVVQRIVEQQPLAPDRLMGCEDLGPITPLVMQALDKDPDARPTASELADGLATLVTGGSPTRRRTRRQVA